MKPVLSALCILALIPVAAPAAEKSPRAVCLEQVARAPTYFTFNTGNWISTENMDTESASNARRSNEIFARARLGSGLADRPGRCDQLSDIPRAAAQTAKPTRVEVGRGIAVWKAVTTKSKATEGN